MVRRTYLACIGSLLAATLAGCSDGNGNGDGGTGTEREFVYVVNALIIDEPPMDGQTKIHGFNLDNRFSPSSGSTPCEITQDNVSIYADDQDQNCSAVNAADGTCTTSPNTGCAAGSAGCTGGVDNRLPDIASALQSFIEGDLRQNIQDSLNNSQVVILVRVSGVNDLTNDDSVRVQVFRGFPTFNQGCTAITPGREYTIDSASLAMGGTGPDQALVNLDARIVNGRLRATGNAGQPLNIPLPPVGETTGLSLNLREVQLRANVSATEGTRGNLGGWISAADLRALASMFNPAAGSVVDTLIDIASSPAMCTPENGGVSLGLGLTMVNATLSTTAPVAAMPASGVCGTTAP